MGNEKRCINCKAICSIPIEMSSLPPMPRCNNSLRVFATLEVLKNLSERQSALKTTLPLQASDTRSKIKRAFASSKRIPILISGIAWVLNRLSMVVRKSGLTFRPEVQRCAFPLESSVLHLEIRVQISVRKLAMSLRTDILTVCGVEL